MLEKQQSSLIVEYGILIIFVGFAINHRFSVLMIGLACLVSIFIVVNFHKRLQIGLKQLSIFISLICAFPLTKFLTSLLHDQFNELGRAIDNPSRLLIMMPLVAILILWPVRQKIFIISLSLTSVLMGLNVILHLEDKVISLSYGSPIYLGAISSSLVVLNHLSRELVLSSESRLIVFVNIAIFMGLIAVIASGSKVAWCVVGLYMFVIFFREKIRPRRRLFILCASILLIFGINFFSNQLVYKKVEDILVNISCLVEDPYSRCSLGSIGVRAWILKSGVEKFVESPITGHGLGSSKFLIQEDIQSGKLPKFDNPGNFHNEILELLVTQGLLGVIGFMGMIGGVVLYVVKASNITNNPYTKMLLLNIIIYLSLGLSQVLSYVSSVTTYFYFSSLILLGLSLSSKKNEPSH